MSQAVMESTLAAIQDVLREQSFGSIEEANEFIKTHVCGRSAAQLAPISEETPPARRAQEIVWDAWEAKGRKRQKLAREALAIDPNCADAYLILSEGVATPEEAIPLYEKAITAGQASFPGEYFTDPRFANSFWSDLTTRPYMRARWALASALYELERLEEAIAQGRDLVRLNPNDNQGVRYELVPWLIEGGHDDEARAVLKQYEKDKCASFLYAQALLSFRRGGRGAASARLMAKALRANPFVPAVLMEDELPEMPETYGIGDYEEGVFVVRT